MPGGGATYVHLSQLVPAIKLSIKDSDEQIGADILAKVRYLFPSLTGYSFLLSSI